MLARLAPEYFSISLTLLTNSKDGRTDADIFYVAVAVPNISDSGTFSKIINEYLYKIVG